MIYNNFIQLVVFCLCILFTSYCQGQDCIQPTTQLERNNFNKATDMWAGQFSVTLSPGVDLWYKSDPEISGWLSANPGKSCRDYLELGEKFLHDGKTRYYDLAGRWKITDYTHNNCPPPGKVFFIATSWQGIYGRYVRCGTFLSFYCDPGGNPYMENPDGSVDYSQKNPDYAGICNCGNGKIDASIYNPPTNKEVCDLGTYNSDSSSKTFGCTTLCTKDLTYKSCSSDDPTIIQDRMSKVQEYFNTLMNNNNTLYTGYNCDINTNPDNIECWNHLNMLSEFRAWNKFIPVDCGTNTNPAFKVPNLDATAGWEKNANNELVVICK